MAAGVRWYLGVSWYLPLTGAGGCGGGLFLSLGENGKPGSLSAWRLGSACLSPFLPSTSLWGALGSCSCHPAPEMPCHSWVAVTLQCPHNDTGWKLVVLLGEGGDVPWARQRRGSGNEAAGRLGQVHSSALRNGLLGGSPGITSLHGDLCVELIIQ